MNYRICCYIPSLFNPQIKHDYAVIISDETGFILIGTNDFDDKSDLFMSQFGLTSMKMTENKILNIVNDEKTLNVVPHMTSNYPTNLMCYEVKTIDGYDLIKEAWKLATEFLPKDVELRFFGKLVAND